MLPASTAFLGIAYNAINIHNMYINERHLVIDKNIRYNGNI